MLDLSKPENKQILHNLGFPDSLIDKLYSKQQNGEKISKFAHFIDSNGKNRIVVIPKSPEEIEKKKESKQNYIQTIKLKKELHEQQEFPIDEYSEMSEEKKLRLQFFKTIKDSTLFKGSCWIWAGDERELKNKTKESYELFKKKLQENETTSNLRHKCDNTKCINPNHLYITTSTEESDTE